MHKPGPAAHTALLRLLENERQVEKRTHQAEDEADERLTSARREAEATIERAREEARAEAERMREDALADGERRVAEEARALEQELDRADAAARAAHERAVAVVTAWVTAEPDAATAEG
jgi:cell division septum initiation protein DivIVA